MDVAKEFGWQPEGTEPPGYYAGRWDGTYFTNDYQEVTENDATAMGRALIRASEAMKSGKLTPKQTELLAGTDLRVIEKLAAYAVSGHYFSL